MALSLYYIMTIYYTLFNNIFDKIESKIGIKANNIRKFIRCLIKQASKYNNFHKILTYLNTINRSSQFIKVIDNAILY